MPRQRTENEPTRQAAMASTNRWLVISPHLDDGVFSCGHLLAMAPGSIVVTVFAGIPPRGTPAPSWDRRAGFATADQAVCVRRKEDRCALDILGAQAIWLDFFDGQYNVPCTSSDIATQLAIVLDAYPDAGVVAPFGLCHSDHLLVQRAALSLFLREKSQRPWFFFEDALYRRTTHLVTERLADWRKQGLVAQPADLLGDLFIGTTAKSQATRVYTSQIALFNEHLLADLHSPESYWQLQSVTTMHTGKFCKPGKHMGSRLGLIPQPNLLGLTPI